MKNFWPQYFEFRTLITPNIIKAVYFLGAFLITATGILSIISPDSFEGYAGGERRARFAAFFLLFVGNVFWRMLCEGVILLFSLHEVAVSIDSRGKGTVETVGPTKL